ncbi:MAG: 2,3-cyclic 3-phosphodiesterase [Solirubrobacteraceae bacterium]|nr:2,3-cyclic 3-phosphodiesterase [Solirubrobacteraceae bacterium]
MRLFVALDLPADISFPLPEPPWRPVPREKQHATLVFLGSVDAAPVFDAAPPAAPLVIDAPVLLPPRRPRVLAIRMTDPTGALTAYQARLARALGVVEERPWLPHVTIGRTRERVRGDAPLPELEAVTFTCASATLYRSAGGRYEALASVQTET